MREKAVHQAGKAAWTGRLASSRRSRGRTIQPCFNSTVSLVVVPLTGA
jgi:hypothetical protein